MPNQDQTDPFDQQPPQDDPGPQALPQDISSPASDPDDAQGVLNVDHPSTDSEVDEHERYDEGLGDAAVDNPPAAPHVEVDDGSREA